VLPFASWSYGSMEGSSSHSHSHSHSIKTQRGNVPYPAQRVGQQSVDYYMSSARVLRHMPFREPDFL
jgi:hypothetical protein